MDMSPGMITTLRELNIGKRWYMFDVNMQATVGMSVSYELFDFQGNRIHRANYSLREGHDADHKVVPSNPIPEGMLVHRFSFVDGSEKTITTIRQPN